MVQFTGAGAKGETFAARRFPIVIGRSRTADLRLEEAGVWDRHAEVRLDAERGYVVRRISEGLLLVNGEARDEAALGNGDAILLGGAKLEFWLADVPQISMRGSEAGFWLGLVLICLGQIAAVYWLTRL